MLYRFRLGAPSFPDFSGLSLIRPLASKEFVTTWKTDNAGVSTSTQIKLPLVSAGTYNFEVDWGDGSSDTITVWNQAETTHTYSSAGTYTVKMKGVMTGWAFANGGDKLKLLSVSNWGELALGNTSGHFYGCANLVVTARDRPTVGANLNSTFQGCTLFNGPVGNWDISTATLLQNTFQDCVAFNQPLNNWDTSNVTKMESTFRGCTIFNQDLDRWNVEKITSFNTCFFLCKAFNGNVVPWRTIAALNMINMFHDCTPFNRDISGWDVSTVTNFTSMFMKCPNFNADISVWDTSSATSFVQFFREASSFNQNIGGWDVSSVTSMADMFNSASLSTANYDALLIGWAAQTLQSGVSFHAGGSKYTTGGAAEAARNDLLDAPELWTIVDGGPA